MLGVCTDWQVLGGEGTATDHDDAAYDGAVLDRLHGPRRRRRARSSPTSPLPSLGTVAYEARFASALAQASTLVRSSAPPSRSSDSYHTVWFELHEDLLSSLGIERTQEGRER